MWKNLKAISIIIIVIKIQRILGSLRESNRIWEIRKETEGIWRNLKESEGTCENLREFWRISKNLEKSNRIQKKTGGIWKNLEDFWWCLIKSKKIWLETNIRNNQKTKKNWKSLKERNRTKMKESESICENMEEFEGIWEKLRDRNESERFGEYLKRPEETCGNLWESRRI